MQLCGFAFENEGPKLFTALQQHSACVSSSGSRSPKASGRDLAQWHTHWGEGEGCRKPSVVTQLLRQGCGCWNDQTHRHSEHSSSLHACRALRLVAAMLALVRVARPCRKTVAVPPAANRASRSALEPAGKAIEGLVGASGKRGCPGDYLFRQILCTTAHSTLSTRATSIYVRCFSLNCMRAWRNLGKTADLHSLCLRRQSYRH